MCSVLNGLPSLQQSMCKSSSGARRVSHARFLRMKHFPMREVGVGLSVQLHRKRLGYPNEGTTQRFLDTFVAICVKVRRRNAVDEGIPQPIGLALVRAKGSSGDSVSPFYPSPYGDLFRSIDP